MILNEKHTSFHDFSALEIVDILKNNFNTSKDFKNLVIMSCQNPAIKGGPRFTPRQNNMALADFKKYLRDNKFKYLPVYGFFGQKEKSFIVKNMSLEDAKKMSGKYFQLSFIFGERKDDMLEVQYWETNGMDDNGDLKPYELKDIDVVEDREIKDSKKVRKEINDYNQHRKGSGKRRTHNFYTKIKGKDYTSHFKIFDEPEETVKIPDELKESFIEIYNKSNR